MKILMIGLTVFSCAITALGETFQMDRKNDAIVEVQKLATEYKVTCRFSPQTKFDKAINAKFNDAKGDSLCKKGLARYLKVATNETLVISGLYSVAPVETMGEKLCYYFGVPISGCNVVKVEVKPPKPIVPEKPAVAVKDELKQPIASNKQAVCNDVEQKQPTEPNKPSAVDLESPKDPTNVVTKTSSFLCVAKYKEINGERKTISRREYQGRNFKNRKEFEQFCQQELARIRAQGEANLRAVRNFGK